MCTQTYQDLEDVRAMVEAVIRQYGIIDFVFNNAGIEGQMSDTIGCEKENWDRVIQVNLTGVFLCTKKQLQHMLQRRKAVIINGSSVAGLVGTENNIAYTASKHGVIGLIKTVSLDHASIRARINAICPGITLTAMIERVIKVNPELEETLNAMEPVGRMGRPEEVAEAVLWLCDDNSAFVTGAAIPVDGAMVAR